MAKTETAFAISKIHSKTYAPLLVVEIQLPPV